MAVERCLSLPMTVWFCIKIYHGGGSRTMASGTTSGGDGGQGMAVIDIYK